MTREEFAAIYQQGEEATFALFSQLAGRVRSLEEKAVKNSHNSSKPPSSDGLRKPPLAPMPQSLRKPSGKKPGGQKGHQGSTLMTVENPDHIVAHRPEYCIHCQSNLQYAAEITYTRRQTFEMPVPRVLVTEHRVVTVGCPCCGKETTGSFPEGVDHPVQYGPKLLGFATYLHAVHLLPYARCAQIVQDVTGTPFSPGSLNRALKVGADRLGDFEQQIKKAVADVSLLHVDETGGRVAGKLNWFHVRCTDTLCYLFRHAKRGKEAVSDLLTYSGRLVSDFYSNYVTLNCAHQFCGAHLLRDLTYAHSVLEQSWAGSLKTVLEGMVGACHRARERGAKKVSNATGYVRRFDRCVAEGLRQNPLPPKPPGRKRIARGKVRCLLDRLTDYRHEYLGFLFDLSLPFTNNEAERGVRMFKVKGKVSGCFRTEAGADLFCRLRSYTQTCQKQGMHLLDCFRSLFTRTPILPSLQPA
jgi:transposase